MLRAQLALLVLALLLGFPVQNTSRLRASSIWLIILPALNPLPSFAGSAQTSAQHSRRRAEAFLEQKRNLPAQGQEEEQLDLLRKAAEIDPGHAVVFQEVAMLQIHRLLRTKAQDDPEHPFLLEAISALSTLGELTRNAQASNWGLINQLLNLGHQAEGKDRPLLARALYDASVKLNPEHGNAVASQYKIREWLCDWRGRDAAFTEVMRRVGVQLDQRQPPSLQPLVALAQEVDLDTQRRVAAAWVALYRKAESQENRFFRNVPPPKLADNRLTVAYMSGDLRGHAVSHQMKAVLEQHSHSSKIRVVILNTFQGNVGAEGREIRSHVHRWVDVRQGDDDKTVAAHIVNDVQAHVIVEMSGHTGGHRLGVLSLRPAPLALSFLGFSATTGADFVDYFVSDRTASPPEISDAFSETLALLPFCFYPFNTKQLIGPAPPPAQFGLPTDPAAFVFANFNRNLKIKPDIFQVWCELVRSTPGSVLWLRRFHRQVQHNLQIEAVARGVSNASVVFAGRLPNRSEHLARHRLAHLFLDTPRFGGHSTLADVLWAGVPAMVLPGEGLASRIGASMLLALRAPLFVARTMQEYAEAGGALARHGRRTLLSQWKERLFQRIRNRTSPLATPAYTERLERLLLLTWESFKAQRYEMRNRDDGKRRAPALVISER